MAQKHASAEGVIQLSERVIQTLNHANRHIMDIDGTANEERLLTAISLTYDLVMTLADFYNARIAELQEALDATTDELDG